MEDKNKDWKRLAQLAAAEEDPEKLLAIVGELNAALAEREVEHRGGTSSKRLLVVDDEESIRLTLPSILREYGFEVQVASNVPQALALIGAQKFDVLLSDLNLGEKEDGFAVVRAMRKANPRCVNILLTGYPAFETAVEAIHHEVDDYLVKPADIESLVRVMNQKLRAKGPGPSLT